MTGADVQGRFDALQARLVPMWESIGAGPEHEQVENTVVVVPSISVDIDLTTLLQQAYEERFLFMLFLLRQPNIRVVYVTSLPISPSIVEYYLQLLPGVVLSNARKRLHLISPADGSSRTLTQKLLERPRLLERIREYVPHVEHAHLVPFTTTDAERELAIRLDIPMYAADPRFFAFGTKSGSRRIFAEEGVPHPAGHENLTSAEDLVAAIVRMRKAKPSIRAVIVKLNEGVTGMGNATIDLTGLPSPANMSEESAIEERTRAMRLELSTENFDWFSAELERQGGIVEELISGSEIHSPSAQLRITPLGEVELLSTHDQLLGGPTGQTYLGARFPADPQYGPAIMAEAAKVGRRFAREGIIGRFALDFMVVRSQAGEWEPYAIEVNLRKGGTTHPFLTLQYLTDGAYDADTGHYATARGHGKCYVATDHLDSPAYRAFTPDDLFDVVSRNRLHFDHAAQRGVILHMMSAVADQGRLGFTAIGDGPDDADELYARATQVLDLEASTAVT